MPESNEEVKKHSFRIHIKFIMIMYILLMIIVAVIGLIFSVGKFIGDMILSNPHSFSQFGNDFSRFYCMLFPYCSLFMLLVVILFCLKNKPKLILEFIVFTPIALAFTWIWGGKNIFRHYQNFMETQLNSEIFYGNSYLDLQKCDDAVSSYKKAAFIDKYLVLWNDNTGLPEYYDGIGQAYSSADRYEDAEKAFEKALEAYDKYNPDDISSISLVHVRMSLVTSSQGKNESTIEHLLKAIEYYNEHTEDESPTVISTAYLFLANAYYNISQYEEAIKYFELGIPMYYDSIEWGFGDDHEARTIAIQYKVASLTYAEYGDQEKADEYNKLYEDFMWYRDLTEEDLDTIINAFHWMKR